MKTTLKTIIFLFSFFFFQNSNAQFIDKLAKKAQKATEKSIERKIEQKATKTTNEGMDEVLNNKNKTSNPDKKSSGENNSNSKISKNQSDFVAGTKVLFEENFKNDAKGDFPVNWFTNSSGELVTMNNEQTKWLQISDKGSFSPLNITKLPENFTFEFDVTTTDNFNFYSTPLNVVFTEKKTKVDNVWNTVLKRSEGVIFNIHPSNSLSAKGRSEVFVISEKKEIIKNKVDVPIFNKANNKVRIQIWRQKDRLRMYVNGTKYWDLPMAFGEANYNQIIFFVGTYKNSTDKFFISNLRLAEAESDKRHRLIETGSFTTSDILFDTNKSTIKPSSASILKEIGLALQENPSIKISITGHTDAVGKDSENQKLSEQRAESVKNYLNKNFNIDKSRISTNGKGASEPIKDNNSEANKQQNRRVEFNVLN